MSATTIANPVTNNQLSKLTLPGSPCKGTHEKKCSHKCQKRNVPNPNVPNPNVSITTSETEAKQATEANKQRPSTNKKPLNRLGCWHGLFDGTLDF
jgi:hypothetical protein